jgi:outer membrane protein
MNFLRDAAILELQRSNVNVLEVRLRHTRDRFAAGEVSRTDVAHVESSLASGRARLASAESTTSPRAPTNRQIIGVGDLAPGAPVDGLSPRTVDGAVARARNEHPTVNTAMYNVDIAALQVKVAEGVLYPTLAAVGTVQKTFGPTTSLGT